MWDGVKSGLGIALALVCCATASAQQRHALDDAWAMIDSTSLDFELDLEPSASQTEATTVEDAIPEIDLHDPFARGAWNWIIYGEIGFGSSVGEMYAAHFGAAYNFLENVSIGFDGAFVYADMHRDDSKDAVGGQADVQIRWHFYRQEKWSLFGDFCGGIIVMSREFPRYGTNFNFIWQFGVGATYSLNEDVWLIGGVRWTHISNGNIFGADSNPGYDGIHVWMGVMVPF